MKIFDWTGPESSLQCADGLLGYGFSNVWFRMEFDDEKMNENAGMFLQKAENQVYKQLHVSPWKDELRIFLRSLLDFYSPASCGGRRTRPSAGPPTRRCT